MRKNPLSNMSAHGGIITSEFLEIIRGEKVANPRVQAESFATFNAAAPKNKGELDQRIVDSWDSLRERWDSLSNRYLKMNVSDARSKWMVSLFKELGFDPGFIKEDLVVDGDDKLRFRLSHRGWISAGAPLLHMVAPSQDLEGASDGAEGEVVRRGRSRSPHYELQAYLNVTKGSKWGIVTNGVLLRILREYYHTTTKGYVEFDIENIFRERSFTDFRAMYRMAHASRFLPDKDGLVPLEQFYKESVAAGVTVGENLRRNVKKAIEALGNGFLTTELAKKMTEDEEFCKAYYSELLRVVYRLLFLLFAEQRAMLPTRDSLYAEEYSITRLREMAETRRVKDDHFDLWQGLKITFQMLKRGCPPLKVFGYNGSLFDDVELSILSQLTCKNDDVLEAIKHLTIIEEERVPKRINYLDLGVSEIGSIYESLLDFVPKVFDAEQEIDGEKIPANMFFLDPRGSGRKTTGSYYTKPRLIDELIKSALKPVVEDRLAKSPDKEKALLSIKVCDPACGSGAFLIAASNYLARELAKLRSAFVEPSDKELKTSTRDVLQHCIYGVDLNPMAVELARVSLWINSSVEEMPLNFLNHHLKCGNSLIGSTLEGLEKGIPDEAFTPIEADNKDFAKQIRSRNCLEQKQKLMMEFVSTDSSSYASEYAQLDEFAEKSTIDVEAKKKKYGEIVNSPDRKKQKLIGDVWTSAFFWALDESEVSPPTQSTLRMIQKENNEVDGSETIKVVKALSEHYRFFDWHLEFPDVFGREEKGFDCVLGNPPWEKVKLQEREFFATCDYEIANATTAAIRSKMILKLKETNPALHDLYVKSLRSEKMTSKFARYSNRYPLSGKGDINTYALFMELALSILNGYGRLGLIVKTGLIADDTMKDFFAYLVEHRLIFSLFDFSNKKGIFPDVIPNERFCLVTCGGSKNESKEIDMSILNEEFDDLDNRERHYLMTTEDIYLMNPNTKTSPMFQLPSDANVCRRIYRRNQILIKEEPEEINPWKTEYHRMFDMTNDSGLFRDKEWLLDKGYSKENSSFVKGNDIFMPLYEAKLFNLFDHRHGTFEGVPRENRFGIKAEPNDPTLDQKKDPEYEIEPRYWVNSNDIRKAFKEKNIPGDAIFLFRNTCRTYTDSRTARGTIVPATAASNGCPVLIFRDDNNFERAKRTIKFACIFSSLTFDYLVRQKMTTGNLNRFILIQIAVPRPEAFNALFEYNSQTKPADEWILQHSPPLFFTTNSLEPFFRNLSMPKPEKWDPEKRLSSQYFIDALIAHVYGLSREDYQYILTQFPILARQEKEAFGEYKAGQLCIEYFDQIKRIEKP